MKKLDAKTKRLLADNGLSTCAYVYQDGIVIKYEKTFRIKGLEFKKEFIDLFPCDVKIYYQHRRTEYNQNFKGRLVFHNPTLLIHGIDHIEIYEQNLSENMRSRGIDGDTVTLVTPEGMRLHEDIYNFVSSCITIQDDKKYSIEDWKDPYYGEAVMTLHEVKAAA